MYYTNEYSVLKNNSGGEDIVIKPNVPFEAFEGDYTVTSFLRIRSKESDALVCELSPGEQTKGVGVVPKPTKTRTTTKE